MPRDDIGPEEMLPVAEAFTNGIRAMGIPAPEGFAEVITALFMVIADIAKSDCHCEACDRIRLTATTLETL